MTSESTDKSADQVTVADGGEANPEPGQPPQPAGPRQLLGERRLPSDFLARSAIPILLVATFILFSVLSPGLFFTWTNIRITLAAQATVLLLSLAATIPLRAGDFDLSIAANMVLSGALVGLLYHHGVPVVACCLLALAVGIVIGLVNSVFIVGLGLGSLIITLGMLTLLTGLISVFTSNNVVSTIPPALITFANQDILGLPVVVWLGWIIALIVWFIFEFTPLGRYLLFLGGNPSAAALAGLRVARLRTGSYVAAALISAIAGILLAGSLGSLDPSSTSSYLLPPFTAAFLGTTTIQPGRFNVLGTVVGLYLLAVGITGLQLLGIQGWVSDVFNGGALILAIAFARILTLSGGRLRRTRHVASRAAV